MMNEELEIRVEEIVSEFLWEMNDETTRNKIAEKLSEAFGFQFKDDSTPTEVDNQFLSYQGYNPETEKMTIITIGNAAETKTCVSCGAETDVPVNQHIDLRKHYVEGTGQLCSTCYDKIYGKH